MSESFLFFFSHADAQRAGSRVTMLMPLALLASVFLPLPRLIGSGTPVEGVAMSLAVGWPAMNSTLWYQVCVCAI